MLFNSAGNQKRTTAEAVLMVKPVDFCFNEETAIDNEFMHRVHLSRSEIRVKVVKEFEGLVQKVRDAGVEVLVFDKEEHPELRDVFTPDAVFPNNWLASENNNLLYTFTMHAENRKAEKKALPFIEKKLLENGFSVKGVVQVGSDLKSKRDDALEGTGSMIIDRINNMVYACRSLRTNDKAFKNFLQLSGYRGILFDTQSSKGVPFYHTNMIMAVGKKFISICLECIDEDQKPAVVAQLKASGKEIIELTMEQVENHCCGNIVELKSKSTGENIIVMSERAYKAFTVEQRAQFEKYSRIVFSNIDTIEEIGGGSARCMSCEIFLKKKDTTTIKTSPATQKLTIDARTSADLVSPANLAWVTEKQAIEQQSPMTGGLDN